MHWLKACDVQDIDVGEVRQIKNGDYFIALYHIEDGFYATQDACTHAVASLADGYVEDGMIECPLHAGKFCIKTGRAKSLPVSVGLKTYSVRVEGSDVYIGIEEAKEAV